MSEMKWRVVYWVQYGFTKNKVVKEFATYAEASRQFNLVSSYHNVSHARLSEIKA